MQHILVIGIGAGDPDHLTLQAAKALARTDVFFILDKNEERQDMIRLRRQILTEHGRPGHRVVGVPDAERDRTTPRTPRPSTTGAAAGPTWSSS